MSSSFRSCPGALLALVLGAAPVSWGAEWNVEPSLTSTVEWTDNVSFARTNPRADWVGTLGPGLRLGVASERGSAELAGEFDFVRHGSQHDLDDERSRARFSGRWDGGERWWATGSAAYSLDSTLETEASETGVATTSAARRRYGPEAGATWTLGDRTSLAATGSMRWTRYDRESLVDYRDDQFSLTWQRVLDAAGSSATVQPQYQHFRSSVSEVDQWALALGWAPRWTERTSAAFTLGGRLTETRWSAGTDGPGTPAGRTKDWGALVDLLVRRAAETGEGVLGFRHDLGYTSDGHPVENSSLYATLRTLWSETWSAGLSASVLRAWSHSERSRRNSWYYDLVPSVTWAFARDHRLSLQGAWAGSTDRRLDDHRTAQRFRLWLTATFTFPTRT